MAAKPKKLSVIERLKRTKTPGAKLFKDATAEEIAALLSPFDESIREAGGRLNAIDLQHDGKINSMIRAGCEGGLQKSTIEEMNLAEFIDEVEIQDARDNRMARKVANEMRKHSNEVKPTWSNARSPSDWVKVFARLNVACRNLNLFRKLRDDGTYREHPETTRYSKSVRLAIADLPPAYSDAMTV